MGADSALKVRRLDLFNERLKNRKLVAVLIVITGKISLFAIDAYFHSWMPMFTEKIGIRMPILT